MKSLPLLQLESITSITVEIADVQIDSFLSPEKPIIQIPYQHSSSKKPITLSFVFDSMQNHRLPPYSFLFLLSGRGILLFDLSLPYMWVDVTDKHFASLLSSFSSLLTLSSLYRHRPAIRPPSLEVTVHSPPPNYLFIGYCRIHPIYFLLSVELNTFVTLSFQRTPLRFRVHPLTQATGRIEDFIRKIVNWLLPSVLLQSPSFVGALDLIGNPANLVISLYNSVLNVIMNPLSAVLPLLFLDCSFAAARESSQLSSKSLPRRSPCFKRSSAALSPAFRPSAAV